MACAVKNGAMTEASPGAQPASEASEAPETGDAAPAPAAATPPSRSQRQHIVATALSLMAQRGVDGTSMRDLAGAAGLNVASLYHYFPSKRDLLVAVLDERGFWDDLQRDLPSHVDPGAPDVIGALLEDVISSMLEVEDFIRLMLGEVMRGDETAHAVGVELLSATQQSLEHWLDQTRPDLCGGPGSPGSAALARVLTAMLVGLFFEHVAGVLEEGGNPAAALAARVREAAAVLGEGQGGR